MKLFQIEEPEGGPVDPSAPGAAIGVDAAGARVEVAFSVGGNALALADREGFEHTILVPAIAADEARWQALFEAARARAERALARPVTDAVIVLGGTIEGEAANRLSEAARRAGLGILRFTAATELPGGATPALAAAILAEDLAPRPELDS